MLPIYIYVLVTIIYTVSNAFPCCVVHETPETCDLETGSACQFLAADDKAYTSGDSAGAKCVSVKWYDQWKADDECEAEPNCTPSPPPPPPPVPPPASQCIMHACTATDKEYNIAFVIDESGSVGKTNYIISLNFIENMIENDIQPNANISILAFASGLDRIYSFTDSQNDQKSGAITAIINERSDYKGGSTYLYLALNEIIREFRDTPFTTPQDENMLFIMTDGYPNGGEICSKKALLDAAGVEVFVVGVGSGFSKKAIKCIVDDDRHILDVPRFDQKDFYKIASQLRNTVCPVVFAKETSLLNHAQTVGSNIVESNVTFWCMIIAGIVFCVGWYFRRQLCEKDGKYQSISDSVYDQYGSVQTV